MQLAQDKVAGPSVTQRMTTRSPDVVKSAVRVIEVLEFFDRTQAPAHVGAVSAALKFPQSSTSALLRSLVTIGYLLYDPGTRTYVPTERVPLLGNWIARSLFRGGPLLALMDHLATKSALAIVLARRNGNRAQYVHLADPHGLAPSGISIGASAPLAFCAAGQILLAEQADNEVCRLMRRLNAEALSANEVVGISDLLVRLADIRQRGYAFATNDRNAELAIRLRTLPASAPLVIGIVGPADMVSDKAPALLSIAREAISTWLVPERPKLSGFQVPPEFAIARTGRAPRRVSQPLGK